uniref:ABC transmembrane type-1 domain-containing protein n=1 Tax=Ditylenchus dipsaci TaxID=166011 RepID=A0A915ES98_9BILA
MGGMTDSFVNATILVEYPLSIVNTSSGLRFFSDIYSLEHFRKSAHLRVLQSFLSVHFYSLLPAFRSYIFDDFERIKEGIGDKVALAIQYTSQFVGGFLVAFVYDWKLTLVMMSLTPFIALCGLSLLGLSIEVLNSMPTVTAFNGQSAELKRYKLALEATTFDCVMRSVYIGAAFAATFFIMFASLSLAFWVGTDFIVDKGCAQKLSLLKCKLLLPNKARSSSTHRLFDGCKPRTKCGFGWKSGAGKSTVFALLLKLYSPSSGKIKIDDQNVENLSSSYLRRHIFGFVVRNLKAQVEKFVLRLPQGYNTIIGGSSLGVNLSGGEKQRIAIARALLKKASILRSSHNFAQNGLKNVKLEISNDVEKQSLLNEIEEPNNIIETFALLDLDEKRSRGHFWALMLLVLGIIQAVSIFGQAALFGLSSESFVRRLRVQLFGHLLCMDMEFFDRPTNSPARMCTRLATDTATIKSAIDYRLGSVCVSFVSLFCGLALALYYGWQ